MPEAARTELQGLVPFAQDITRRVRRKRDVTDEAKVEAAFAACACGLQLDACHFDFQSVTGILAGRAMKVTNSAKDEYLEARVDLGKEPESRGPLGCDDARSPI